MTGDEPAPVPLVHDKVHMEKFGIAPGLSGGKPATNRLSHGTVRPRRIRYGVEW